MHPLLKAHKVVIEEYCAANGLSAKRLLASAHSGNDSRVVIYHHEPQQMPEVVVIDNRPATITLKIFLEDGNLRFEQTEVTRRYLGAA